VDDPLEQHVVRFYSDDLLAVQQSDGTILVLFAKLCENLGLNRESQVRRIQRHAVLSKALVSLVVQTSSGVQTALCLRLDMVPLYFSGIQVERVKPHLREMLLRYQGEAADVLWRAFRSRILDLASSAETAIGADTGIVELERIRDMGRAIASLAEQQIELQRQQQTLANRVDRAGLVVRALQGDVAAIQIRLGSIEGMVRPGTPISAYQAAEVSQKVKALAEQLTGIQGGKNFYQGIFGELYRRFHVTSYKELPQALYPELIAFLDDWSRAAQGGQAEPPASRLPEA
jgi:P22_AR N-terminal domain